MTTHELAEYLLQYPDMEVRIGGRDMTKPLDDLPNIIGVPIHGYVVPQRIWVWEGIPEDERAEYRPAMEFYLD